LSALGIDFALQPGDVAARANFATLSKDGIVNDRRAGRIETALNERLVQKIRDRVSLNFDGTFFFETVSEHRAVLVLRGDGLSGAVQDTDPQSADRPPNSPQATAKEGEKTASLIQSFLRQVTDVLADEHPANGVLLRGFERFEPLPSLQERFGLKGVCIADYPMYRGVSRLVGMDVMPRPGGLAERFETLASLYGDDHNFYFIHVKKTDSLGEDADFDRKVVKLEQVDQLLPKITDLNPDILVVTADHSTPAAMGRHSWHPVPVMLKAKHARVDKVDLFDDYACAEGMLGRRPGTHLMGLALANAGRLRKYGA
jgi:2,3-bisphosphoglycerate-independent phosphoglycerate mutase